MFQINAIDKNGVKRVFGRGPTLDEAEIQCRKELAEYLKLRREMKYEDFTLTIPYAENSQPM